jgi:1-acyl-sn-glycerol-3-phosphate acyltransferase
VFPEGTRSASYSLRQFKKGPFVLAITTQAPMVPVAIHGTLALLPKGKFWLKQGRVDVHFLEPVSTEGLTYDDRSRLSQLVRERIGVVLRDRYGVADALPGQRNGRQMPEPLDSPVA